MKIQDELQDIAKKQKTYILIKNMNVLEAEMLVIVVGASIVKGFRIISVLHY